MIHDENFHAWKLMSSPLATAGSDEEPSEPLLLDQDTDVINSMSPTVKPVTWQEVKMATSKDKYIIVLMNLGSYLCMMLSSCKIPSRPGSSKHSTQLTRE